MKKTVRDMDVKESVSSSDAISTYRCRRERLPMILVSYRHCRPIRYLTEHGAKVILMSHMGRPKGEPKKEFTLQPVADRLTQLLGKQVVFAASDRVVDENVQQAAAALADGDVMLFGKRQIPQGGDPK